MKASHPIGRHAAAVLSLVLSLLGSFTATATDTNIIAWPANYLTNVPNLSTNAIAVTGGDNHCIALLADRTVQTWGRFAYGGSSVPPADATNIVGIAAGSGHALAVRGDGTVALWGRIIGNGSTQVPPELTNVVAVGVGSGAQHALALRADGTVVDWGLSDTTNVPPGVLNIVSVAVGPFHSLALHSDGRVFAWGRNYNSPTAVPAGATNIVAIATTWFGNIALRADGKLLTWGAPEIPGQATLTNIVEVAGKGGNSSGGMALNRHGNVFATGTPASATNTTAIGGSGLTYMAVKAVGPPLFPLPAVRRTVAATRTAYFRLPAVGALPLSYQWSFQGTNLLGATNPVLAVTGALQSHAGPYALTVTNVLGVATSSEMLLTVEPLEVIAKPKEQTVLAGKNATFTTTTVGQGPFTYQWKFEGADLPSATNSSLTLTNIYPGVAGKYSVVASNLFGGMTSPPASLIVVPLQITGPPLSQTVVAGTNVNFSVTVGGPSPFDFQWRFGGTNLTGATNSSLTLSNVQLAQAGPYSVTVTNIYGGTVSSIASLNVLPMAITAQPSNVLALLWSPAIFSVSAVGEGPFTYQWRFNGTNLDGATTNPLVLTNAHLWQAGAYSVSIRNVHGVTSSIPAILSLRQVAVWGDTGSGQAEFPLGLTNVVAIAAGYYHTLALRQDGTVSAWSSYDQTNIPPYVSNIVAISAGLSHNLGLKADTTVVSWGPSYYSAGTVPAGLSNAVAVACGEEHSLVLKADGTVVAWGAGTTNSGVWPDLGQSIVPAGLSNVVAISAKGTFSLALKDDGTVVAWGANYTGQTNVPFGVSNVIAIATGYKHGLALQNDGALVTWGGDDYNQLSMPPGITNVVSIAAGSWNSLALTADSKVIAWGRTDMGQTNVPTNLVNVMAIAGGNFHLAALLGESLPPSHVSLTNVNMSPAGLNVSLPSESGRIYRLEYKANLSDSNWIALPLVAGTGGVITLTDSDTADTQRFYRVRRW